MAAIQYTGINNVLRAFENNDIPYFAIFSGKALIFKNPPRGETGFDETSEAANFLQLNLEGLNQGSNAIYTLKLYETIPAGGITEKTPANYSINFRLGLEGMDRLPQKISAENMQTEKNEILTELRALRMRVDEMETEPEPDEKPGGILGALMNNEAVLNMIVASVAGLGAHFLEKLKISPINKPITTMAGINDQTEPNELDKINKAIEVLSKSDSNLGNHLLILAKMSIDNPTQFHWLIGMLK